MAIFEKFGVTNRNYIFDISSYSEGNIVFPYGQDTSRWTPEEKKAVDDYVNYCIDNKIKKMSLIDVIVYHTSDSISTMLPKYDYSIRRFPWLLDSLEINEIDKIGASYMRIVSNPSVIIDVQDERGELEYDDYDEPISIYVDMPGTYICLYQRSSSTPSCIFDLGGEKVHFPVYLYCKEKKAYFKK